MSGGQAQASLSFPIASLPLPPCGNTPLPRLVHSAWLGARRWSRPRSIVESCWPPPLLALPFYPTMHWAGHQAKGLRFFWEPFLCRWGADNSPTPAKRPPQGPKHELTWLECHLHYWRKVCTKDRQLPQMESFLLPQPQPSIFTPAVLASCPLGNPAIHSAPHP